MFQARLLVNRATGSSPPLTLSRESATSPINVASPIQMTVQGSFYDCSSTTITQEKHNWS